MGAVKQKRPDPDTHWLYASVIWALAALLLGATCGYAQQVHNPEPVLYIMPSVQKELAEKYRATQADSLSLEYGACLTYEVIPLSDEARLYRVTGLRYPPQAADILRAPDGRIYMYRLFMFCRTSELHLHTHSRHQCTGILGSECIDHPDLWMKPSPMDRASVRNVVLAIIQYRDSSFLNYFPDSVPREMLARGQPDYRLRRDLYISALTLGVVSNAVFKWDTHGHGDKLQLDQWTLVHGVSGIALESLGESLRVPAVWRVGAVCATGVGWEYSQGRPDYRDALATCGGAVVGALLRRAFR